MLLIWLPRQGNPLVTCDSLRCVCRLSLTVARARTRRVRRGAPYTTVWWRGALRGAGGVRRPAPSRRHGYAACTSGTRRIGSRVGGTPRRPPSVTCGFGTRTGAAASCRPPRTRSVTRAGIGNAFSAISVCCEQRSTQRSRGNPNATRQQARCGTPTAPRSRGARPARRGAARCGGAAPSAAPPAAPRAGAWGTAPRVRLATRGTRRTTP